MDEELAKMIKYEVWEVVPRTAGMRVLKARWVFTRKIDGDTGLEAAFRARWVAKGFTQIQGLDFNEVFASVAHKDTVRIFLSLVNYHKLFCDQVISRQPSSTATYKKPFTWNLPRDLRRHQHTSIAFENHSMD